MWTVAIGAGCLVGIATGCSSGTSKASDTGDAAPNLTAGLVAWYPMDSLAAGATPDATGSGHTATCAGSSCPTLVPGHLGMAVQFDGSTQFLQVSDHPDFHLGAYTFAVWVEPQRVPSFFDNVLGKPLGAASDDSWAIDVLNPGVAELFTANPPASDHLKSTANLPLNTWSHVATTWDGTTKRLFINGASISQSPWASSAYDDHPVVIGADIDNGKVDGWLQGMVDDVRIYGRVLSDVEIAQLAAQ